jgi:hypothetical protein
MLFRFMISSYYSVRVKHELKRVRVHLMDKRAMENDNVWAVGHPGFADEFPQHGSITIIASSGVAG